MRRWGLLLLLPAMLALWLILVHSGLMPPLSSTQRADLILLRAPPSPVTGSNAFQSLWLAAYEVPASQHEALLQLPPEELPRELQAGFTARSSPEGVWSELCRNLDQPCLAPVRDAHAELAGVLQRSAGVDAALRGLQRHGHYRDPRHNLSESELPPFAGFVGWSQVASALEAVDGRPAQALQRLCDDAAAWRRLRHGSNSLVVDVWGVRQIRLSARLLSELLREAPTDLALPASCAAAFAPLADSELDQCPAMQREFRLYESTLRESLAGGKDISWSDRVAGGFFSSEHTLALMGSPLARHCSVAERKHISLRQPLPAQAPPKCNWLGWSFNPFGCVLTGVGPGDIDRYFLSLLDLDRELRVVGTALWLRDQAGDPAQAFAQRPASLAQDDLRFHTDPSSGDHVLSVPLLAPGTTSEFRWTWPSVAAAADEPAAE